MPRTTLFDNQFTGSNGASVVDVAPTVGANMASASGGWTIQDNRAYGANNFTSSHVLATTDQSSVSNGLITMTAKYVAAPSSGSVRCAGFMRRTNGANFIRVETTLTLLNIYEFTGGGAVDRQVCSYAVSWAVGDTNTFGMELNGTVAKLFWNGAEVANGTISYTTAAESAGELVSTAPAFSSTTGFHFDRMLLESLDSGSTFFRPYFITG
jgi:hypothetical protein